MTASDAGREHLRAVPRGDDRHPSTGDTCDLGGICPGSTDDVLRAVSVSSLDPNKRVTLIAEALVTIPRGRVARSIGFTWATVLSWVPSRQSWSGPPGYR